MSDEFFERPIPNSPYESPQRHWELDAHRQPTQNIIKNRRRAEFISPIPKPRKRRGAASQEDIAFDEGKGLSTKAPQYVTTSMINQQRVMPELMGLNNILALNDEAHHCHRETPGAAADDETLKGDEREETEKNTEVARLWIPGLEAVKNTLGISRVLDLSATPSRKPTATKLIRAVAGSTGSSCSSTMDTATRSCCTRSLRSKATGARTRRKNSRRWIPPGCPA